VGVVFTGSYIIASVYGGMKPWTFGVFDSGIKAQGIGSIGMVLNFAVTLGLARFFPPPSAKVQSMIDDIREPEGSGAAIDIERAMDH
ncbi:MAG: cation acetate symporter, partial [Verrucomicrobiota bacterium]